MKATQHLREARMALEEELGDDESRNFFVRAILRTVEIALDQASCVTEHDKSIEQPITF